MCVQLAVQIICVYSLLYRLCVCTACCTDHVCVQLAVGVSDTVYTWGTSPDMLRLHVSRLRRLRQSGRLHAAQAAAAVAENFHTPRYVDTAGVKSHIIQASLCLLVYAWYC